MCFKECAKVKIVKERNYKMPINSVHSVNSTIPMHPTEAIRRLESAHAEASWGAVGCNGACDGDDLLAKNQEYLGLMGKITSLDFTPTQFASAFKLAYELKEANAKLAEKYTFYA